MAIFFPHSVDTHDALNWQAFFFFKIMIYIQSRFIQGSLDLYMALYLGSFVAHQSSYAEYYELHCPMGIYHVDTSTMLYVADFLC